MAMISSSSEGVSVLRLEEVAGFVGCEVYWIQRDYGFGPNR
jgi:hypothetical protein